MDKVKPSAKQVRALLSYDLDSGIFRWRGPAGRHGRIPAGSIAGGLNGEGYRYISISGVPYRAARLAWFMVTGKWPKHQIDHQDCDPSNDRWSNLRAATSSQNKQNCGLYKNNTSGFKCVHWQPDRSMWRAYIVIDGKRKGLRRWPTPEQAYAEFCEMSKIHYGEFSRLEKRR